MLTSYADAMSATLHTFRPGCNRHSGGSAPFPREQRAHLHAIWLPLRQQLLHLQCRVLANSEDAYFGLARQGNGPVEPVRLCKACLLHATLLEELLLKCVREPHSSMWPLMIPSRPSTELHSSSPFFLLKCNRSIMHQ